MIEDGIDEQGIALIPEMPYQLYHHLTDEDVTSIVMYLRSVPPVDGTPQRQPPWRAPAAPSAPVPSAAFPQPVALDNHIANGRYLASIACADCHSLRTNPQDAGTYDLTKLYAGGVHFSARSLGLPVPPYPADIYAWNLTPPRRDRAAVRAPNRRRGAARPGPGGTRHLPADAGRRDGRVRRAHRERRPRHRDLPEGHPPGRPPAPGRLRAAARPAARQGPARTRPARTPRRALATAAPPRARGASPGSRTIGLTPGY